ncbi:MAG TPA: hypothetical protein VNL14_16610 [Candidatus Acidoferrales bacterium]|nr:hypothetical protein [Candidatus Acidoferrales bacterium]
MPSPNLSITHLVGNQNNPHVTANEAIDKLDKALCDSENIPISTADVTLTSAQALENMHIKTSGTLTANRNLIVPTNKKLYLVEHGSGGGFNITVKTAAGTGVTLTPGQVKLVYCDGTNVIGLS